MTRLTTCAIVLSLPLVALAQASRPASPEARLTRELPPVVFSGMGLEKALAKLSEMSGLDIRADWPALAQAGVRPDSPVQFRSEKASLDKLLDLMLASVSRKPLAWVRQGEQVIVSTQQGILARNRAGREDTSASPSGAAPAGAAKAATPAPARSVRPSNLGGKSIKLELNETPLSNALDFVRDLTGVNIHVNWRALEVAGVTPESTVTLKVQDVPPAKMLDLILDTFNANKDKFGKLYWVIDDGVVEIATGEALNTKTKVQTYDISDLLMAVPSFGATAMNLTTGSGTGTGTGNTGTTGSTGMGSGSSAGGSNSFSSGGMGSSGGTGYGSSGTGSSGSGSGSGGWGNSIDTGGTKQDVQNSLLQIIRDAVGQDMWQPTGKGTMQVLNGRLVISQTLLGFKLMEQAFR